MAASDKLIHKRTFVSALIVFTLFTCIVCTVFFAAMRWDRKVVEETETRTCDLQQRAIVNELNITMSDLIYFSHSNETLRCFNDDGTLNNLAR